MDYCSCNALINTVIAATGGLDRAWVLNAADLLKIIDGDALLLHLFLCFLCDLAGVAVTFFHNAAYYDSRGNCICVLSFFSLGFSKSFPIVKYQQKPLLQQFTLFLSLINLPQPFLHFQNR